MGNVSGTEMPLRRRIERPAATLASLVLAAGIAGLPTSVAATSKAVACYPTAVDQADASGAALLFEINVTNGTVRPQRSQAFDEYGPVAAVITRERIEWRDPKSGRNIHLDRKTLDLDIGATSWRCELKSGGI